MTEWRDLRVQPTEHGCHARNDAANDGSGRKAR